MSGSTSFTSSTSSTSQTINGHTTGTSHSEQSHTTPAGTTVHTSSQNMGEAAVQETHHFDPSGKEIEGGNGASANNRIEDVTGTQEENDRVYEERMEEEYAKREGGA